MPELELGPEEQEKDPAGKRVGVQAAILAVLLAVVTIASHRAHTTAVITRTEANDPWSFYQAKRMKFHNLELGSDLMKLVGGQGAGDMLARYESESKRYEKEGEEAQAEARKKESETGHVEAQALRYDIGEGMLEIGVVLSSL